MAHFLDGETRAWGGKCLVQKHTGGRRQRQASNPGLFNSSAQSLCAESPQKGHFYRGQLWSKTSAGVRGHCVKGSQRQDRRSQVAFQLWKSYWCHCQLPTLSSQHPRARRQLRGAGGNHGRRGLRSQLLCPEHSFHLGAALTLVWATSYGLNIDPEASRRQAPRRQSTPPTHTIRAVPAWKLGPDSAPLSLSAPARLAPALDCPRGHSAEE